MSMDMFNEWAPHILEFALMNFAFTMFLIAVLFMLIHRLVTWGHSSQYEVVYRWTALFAVGITGVYAFVMHAFYPQLSAETIGWATSPFQYEVAMADLAFGLLAIFSFNASTGFRLATAFGTAIWLWGDASGHLYQIIVEHDYAVGNSGSWFWMDLILPFILLFCVARMKANEV